MAQHSAVVVVFKERSEHLRAHLRLPRKRYVGCHHLIVGVQVVTGGETKVDSISVLNNTYVDKLFQLISILNGDDAYMKTSVSSLIL